jgi:hypothetical protein
VVVDAQRPYSAEPPPWYNDRDDASRPPGQRDPRYGERYPEDRFGDETRYGDESRYGDDQRYPYESGEQRFDALDPRYDPADPARTDPARTDPARTDPGRGDAEPGGRQSRGGRTHGPRSGLAMPADGTDPTQDEPGRYRTEMLDRGQLRRPGEGGAGPAMPGSPASMTPSVNPTSTVYQAGSSSTQALPASLSGGAPREAYRSRRSGIAVVIGLVAAIAEVLILLRVLANSMTAHPVNTSGVLAGVFAMCGIPLIAVGLYGLATGAAIASGPNVGRAWLRTPLAYLPIGLVLIFAAGLAA